jgi:thioester reductase-like protein
VTTNQTILLTGFPGFIAGRLLIRLARDQFKFLLLVQPSLVAQATLELAEIAAATSRPLEDFTIVKGDITEPELGLSKDALDRARSETNIIFHLAALYDLAVKVEPARRVNLLGTQNVNSFARSLSNLSHYHYISTCYVAGKRQGRILETELVHQSGFRNHYEETKYLAELEVERLKLELPVTIHRPAVVCGDSHSGETAKYDGIYYLIHYLLRWPKVLTLFNIGNKSVRLNLVPVDFVVAALASLACDESVRGKTLQLADPNPLTTEEIFDVIAQTIQGRESVLTLPARLVELTLMSPPSPAITGLPHHGVPYFFLRQTYDTSEAAARLSKHQLSCPPFTSYVRSIVDFAASHPKLPAKLSNSAGKLP